jgi:hypothetical protein
MACRRQGSADGSGQGVRCVELDEVAGAFDEVKRRAWDHRMRATGTLGRDEAVLSPPDEVAIWR